MPLSVSVSIPGSDLFTTVNSSLKFKLRLFQFLNNQNWRLKFHPLKEGARLTRLRRKFPWLSLPVRFGIFWCLLCLLIAEQISRSQFSSIVRSSFLITGRQIGSFSLLVQNPANSILLLARRYSGFREPRFMLRKVPCSRIKSQRPFQISDIFFACGRSVFTQIGWLTTV